MRQVQVGWGGGGDGDGNGKKRGASGRDIQSNSNRYWKMLKVERVNITYEFQVGWKRTPKLSSRESKAFLIQVKSRFLGRRQLSRCWLCFGLVDKHIKMACG